MESPPLWSITPFLCLLLGIALLPLVAGHWWERNRNKAWFSAALALPFAAWMLLAHGAGGWRHLQHALLDYVSYISLLGSLFVIAGGIHIRGSLSGTPLANSALLGVGAILANFIGTTGASMVLIRPLLRANAHRRRRVHLVLFFIFVVSNSGGLLTPLADPPLFLGFLKGVPFDWTLRLWPHWLLVNGAVLVLFNLVDQHLLNREEAGDRRPLLEDLMRHQRLRVDGAWNLLFLAGVILVILGKGYGWFRGGHSWPFGVQEGLMLGLAVAGYFTTPGALRAANRFTFHPLVEVAVLFAGIFVTMTVPLQILNERGAGLGLTQPWEIFWATGALSSFLDNAPTYLAFGAAAAGRLGISSDSERYLGQLLETGPQGAEWLAAISCGAVMMGALTYIGNGPNFMVKAIAEENGIRMPSFFGYMLYACAILVPVFVLVTLVFFR
ncbi:MAG: sodium:proton antiporter [Planctomycetota bacterium]|nr:MAG: sodium:proton antiporter [Planctomycetota bacterium]